MAQKIGADAASVITSCFISPSENELHEHYATIAKSTNLPVLLYNNPGRTGVKLSVDLVKKLSRIENIVGIKKDTPATTCFIKVGHVLWILKGVKN